MTVILAAKNWGHNGKIIEALHDLEFIKDSDSVLDLTYGKGVWWKTWHPANLITNDINLNLASDHHYDFRHLPKKWRDNFDVVAFDPAYVSPGGRKTSTLGEQNDRYDMQSTPKSPLLLHTELVMPGLKAAARVIRPGGIILHKTQSYVSSGKYQSASHWAYGAGVQLGLVLAEEIIFVTQPSRQPKSTKSKSKSGKVIETLRKQRHARHNFSIMYIWRKR